ncbi:MULTISPECIES: S1C family serine protease [unclassified Roseateles]|uniref:S1C family serine protease n=1 Tax=unclassified Roseateles TaxID=2626991 RepID=UPI000714040E|nr:MULTISPECIES: trypsin-like peptidase domain-containing protein [unclassified Roseateles]KQW42957.1 2-alkenal reductase [Pelomonas sp. Root405]
MLKRLWLIFAQAVTVALAVLFVISTLKPQWLQRPRQPDATIAQTARQIALPPSPAASVVRAGFAQAARVASPAVVSITASKAPSRAGRAHEPLFGFPGFPFGQRQPRGSPQLGLGSGVIISADGVLLTNNHVVEGASDIEVMLSDGRQAQAKLIGTDPETDVAVLKIDLPDLPTIALGDAASLQVGDVVLAIGNPFNVGQTVTSGIVSALGRNQLGINTFENFIQTDAAINPGNSGGALVDADGRLVGINTAIFSRSGGSLGIGFAIPVDVARQVASSLLQDGVVARGWIGVQTRELTPELADALKLGDAKGVLIGGVVNDAPAAQAGIRPGDVLTRIGERTVATPAELLASVAALKPGAQVDVGVQRAGKPMTFQLAVTQRPKPQRDQDD